MMPGLENSSCGREKQINPKLSMAFLAAAFDSGLVVIIG